MNMSAHPRQRTFQPVRRDSYDVEDPRAQVFKPIQGGIKFVDAYVATCEEWGDLRKKKGEQHRLSSNVVKVLRTLFRFTDFATGICEPCLDTLMQKTRLARATVVRALAILADEGFINWIRRTVRTDNDPDEGPAVRQVSNAYFFDLTQLPQRVLKRLNQKLRKSSIVVKPDRESRKPLFAGFKKRRSRLLSHRREEKAAALAAARPQDRAAILYPGDAQSQRIHNQMLGFDVGEGASSEASLNPPPEFK